MAIARPLCYVRGVGGSNGAFNGAFVHLRKNSDCGRRRLSQLGSIPLSY
jgi:hypothetical protein